MSAQMIVKDSEEKMKKTLDMINHGFAGIRTGRANSGMVESIRVDYYGNQTPLKQMANITVPEPRMILIQPWDATAIKSLMAATGGGVAAAIDFVGAGSSFAFGLGALRKAGHLICVGLFGGSTPLAPALLALKAVRISGSYVGSPQEMAELMALARAGQVAPLPINTRPLAEADAALADLKAGRIRGRTVLTP